MPEQLPDLPAPSVEGLMSLVDDFAEACHNNTACYGNDPNHRQRRQSAHEAIRSYAERLAVDARMAQTADHIANYVCREVAELPNRTSPEDWPEAMLVTHDELRAIVIAAHGGCSVKEIPHG